jgi:uncharacterized protein with NRDE domain
MCLIAVAWRAQQQYPCLIAANRDEFHARPSAPARWWADKPDILAGKDLQGGGTWLGVTRGGRFVALTNFRGADHRRADAPSRGHLVTSLLESAETVVEGLSRLKEISSAYNGFSILFSDGERLGIFESVPGSGRELSPGVYGLSNHLLDTPWPKVMSLKSRLAAALPDTSGIDPFLVTLRDEMTGAFIRADDYGTRCSTIIRAEASGQISFDEWTWNSDGTEAGRMSERFLVA